MSVRIAVVALSIGLSALSCRRRGTGTEAPAGVAAPVGSERDAATAWQGRAVSSRSPDVSPLETVVIDRVTGSGYRPVQARVGPTLLKPAPFVRAEDSRIGVLPGDLIVAASSRRRTEDPTSSALVDVRSAKILAEFAYAFDVSTETGYLSVGWPARGGGWERGLVRLADGKTTRLRVSVANGDPAKRAIVYQFPGHPAPWVFAEGGDGRAFAQPLRDVPADGAVTLTAVFPAHPDWVDDRDSSDVGWTRRELPVIDGSECPRVRLVADGTWRCRVGIEPRQHVITSRDGRTSATSFDVTSARGEDVSVVEGCSARVLGVLRSPFRVLGACKAGEDEEGTRYGIWSADDRRWGWSMAAPDTVGISVRAGDQPIWAGPGPILEGLQSHTEWIDLERGIRFRTRPLIPVGSDVHLFSRLIPVVSVDEPRTILVLDLMWGVLERAVGGDACKGSFDELDRKADVSVLACILKRVPYDEGAFSLILDMREKTVARPPVRVQRLTQSGLAVGRVVRGGQSLFVRVDRVTTTRR
jgi:hypothetical protein